MNLTEEDAVRGVRSAVASLNDAIDDANAIGLEVIFSISVRKGARQSLRYHVDNLQIEPILGSRCVIPGEAL